MLDYVVAPHLYFICRIAPWSLRRFDDDTGMDDVWLTGQIAHII